MCKIRRLLNRFGKSIKKTVAEKAVLTDKRTMRKKDVAEPVYKPVINRPGVISNGEFIYKVEIEDLFSDGKDGLDYQELLGNFQVVANLGKHILDIGGLITRIYLAEEALRFLIQVHLHTISHIPLWKILLKTVWKIW